MGYACPVCDDPQQDAEHLANHLAFQAMTHGDDHESWLDEHTSNWADGGPADLAPQVAAVAEETEYEVVFDDTAPDPGDGTERYDPDLQGESGHGHDHSQTHDHGRPETRGGDVDTAGLGPEARQVVEDARELTREMLGDGTDAPTGDGTEEGDSAESDGDEGERRDGE